MEGRRTMRVVRTGEETRAKLITARTGNVKSDAVVIERNVVYAIQLRSIRTAFIPI